MVVVEITHLMWDRDHEQRIAHLEYGKVSAFIEFLDAEVITIKDELGAFMFQSLMSKDYSFEWSIREDTLMEELNEERIIDLVRVLLVFDNNFEWRIWEAL